MPLFGAVHVSLLAAIAAVSVLVAALSRSGRASQRAIRLALGIGLAANEIGWYVFRYSHEGIRTTNLPLQLCDVTPWAAAYCCLRQVRWVLEFAYYAGLSGAGMALATPDLWSPWPSYPAVDFFVSHGGTIVALAALVYGGAARVRVGPPWRAFALVLAFAALVGAFDAAFGANYMYLRQKPESLSLLNAFGPWPLYLAPAAGAAILLFWLLWLPVRYRPNL